MQFRWYRFGELTPDKLYSLLALRQGVLVVEQLSPYRDLDFIDQTASHLLATTGAGLVGYLRCYGPLAETTYASFGRLVVAKQHRGKGLGKELVQRALACLAQERCDVVIGAQLYLEKFYSHFGFVRDSEPYDDAGVLHIKMRLRLRKGSLGLRASLGLSD
jgi:ElaA protein